MAYTLTIPGRKTPYNCNKTAKALAMYRMSPAGTVLRKNNTGAKVCKYG